MLAAETVSIGVIVVILLVIIVVALLLGRSRRL